LKDRGTHQLLLLFLLLFEIGSGYVRCFQTPRVGALNQVSVGGLR